MSRIASRGEALRLHQAGWSVARIAHELGVLEDSVRRSLERAGVRLRVPARRAVRQDRVSSGEQEEALLAAVLVLERFWQLASAIRDLAAEHLFSRAGEPAAQEWMLAARKAKENAADCLFYGRLALRPGTADPERGNKTTDEDIETIHRLVRLLGGDRPGSGADEAAGHPELAKVTDTPSKKTHNN